MEKWLFVFSHSFLNFSACISAARSRTEFCPAQAQCNRPWPQGYPRNSKECINNPESLHSDLVEAGLRRQGREALTFASAAPGEYFSPVPDVAGVLLPGGLRLESKDNLSRPGAQFI